MGIVERLRDADERGVAPPQNWTTVCADLIEQLEAAERERTALALELTEEVERQEARIKKLEAEVEANLQERVRMQHTINQYESGDKVSRHYACPDCSALRAAITEAEKVEPKCHATETLCSTCDNDFRKCVRFHPPQPAIPAGMVLVSVEPIKTGDPEISREHLVAIAEKCGLLGAYRTREVVDAIVGYGQVILRDKAVQEAMYRAALAAAPKPENSHD